MIRQTSNGHHFNQRARQVRDQVTTILTNWGLLPRFKRWRLTQDADTGMVVLFGILNNRYIAAHTAIPFSDYFDPRLLHDLADELQLQVVSCISDGLRYAFILDRGRFGELPTHVDYPFVDNGKVMVRVVYGNNSQSAQAVPADTAIVDDKTLVQQGVGTFLKVFDDIKLRGEAELLDAQNQPEVVVISEDEFKRRVAEQEVIRQRSKRLKTLFESQDQENQQ